MAVLCRDPNALPTIRIGFSVSRRIGGAVVRNRVRRLMREAVRAHYALLSPGWDVVFIARKGILGADYRAVEMALLQLLRTAHLLRAPEGAHRSGGPRGGAFHGRAPLSAPE
jgi:ribonuclease P protein component